MLIKKCYIIGLVTKVHPYFSLGYVRKDSLSDGVLRFTRSLDNALVADSREVLEGVMRLISEHNSNSDNVGVMDWITEFGSERRLFLRDI